MTFVFVFAKKSSDRENNNQIYFLGQNVPPEEASRLAVESAIKYHQTIKTGNAEVNVMIVYSTLHVPCEFKGFDKSSPC